MIDLSIIFLYKCAKRLYDKRFATLSLALCALNPLNYLLIFWTYTVTYSLPFFSIVIYLYIILIGVFVKQKR